MKRSLTPIPVLAACLLALMQVGTGYAQPRTRPSLDPTKAISQYHLDRWSNNEGLPMNSVMAVAQTPDGYLWVGTEEGLARFDGVRFTTFNPENTEALRSGHVLALLAGRDGSLWIGTNGGGLLRYRAGRFQTFTTKHGLPSDDVGALYEDEAGGLWIGTLEGVARLHNGTIARFGQKQGLDDPYVLSLTGDRRGTVWIGTRSGIKRHRGGVISTPAGFSAEAFWSLYVDRAGTLWAGTERGLIRHDGRGTRRFTSAEGLQGDHVLALHEDPRGVLWVGTDAGLSRFVRGHLSAAGNAGDATAASIAALFSDAEGSLWFGTVGVGLARLKDLKFTTITRREGLADNQVWVVYEDRRGRMWAGTDGGLSRLENGSISNITTADGLSSDYVMSLSEDEQGVLWAGTFGGGVNRVDGARVSHLTIADGLPDNNIISLYRDRRNRMWIGTTAGLAYYADGKVTVLGPEQGGPQEVVLSMLEDRSGTLWLGTRTGLYAWRAGRFKAYTRKDGLPSDYVLALHEDANGALWIGTSGGGLARFADGRFATFGARQGLPSQNIFRILEDGSGRLWLTSNIGIVRVDRTDLEDVADGRVPAVQVTVYDQGDGLRNRECNGGGQPAGWRARDGKLWFPTVAGLAVIHPEFISANNVPPPPIVETLTSGGVAVRAGGSIELPPSHGDLEIQYTAPSLLVPGEVTFQYRLEGYDEHWVDAGTRRTAYYTNIPPGHYTFHVRARNNDGIWSNRTAALSLYLEPAFYQTRLFYAACALLLGFTVFAGYRFRIRRLEAREEELVQTVEDRTRSLRAEKERTEKALLATEQAHQEAKRQETIAVQARAVIEEQAKRLRELDEVKTRFFNNISHEFRTPLTLTIGPLENALCGMYGPVGEPLRNQLDLTLRNARRLLRLINQLLDISKVESGTLAVQARPGNVVPFVEGILMSFTAFAEERNLDLRFRASRDELPLYFDPTHLEKVFFNLISNSVKFTPAGGEISVEVEEQLGEGDASSVVEIRVRDSGPGIPKEEQHSIFDRFHQVKGTMSSVQQGTGIGLSLARELVELHGGTLTVESTPGEGATFIVRLKEGRAHLTDEQILSDAATQEETPARSTFVEVSAVEPASVDEAPTVNSAPAGARTILVVDDNREVRAYVRSILASTYRIVEAGNGAEGLRMAGFVHPDLILSDVMMPEMDGYTFCRHVKESPELRHIPVILLTAKASEDQKIEGLQLGADDYMAKPFNGQELLARIANQIRLREQERALKEMNDHLEAKVQAQIEVILKERRRYEETLVAAKDRAEESARLKDAILTNMSHEIRTPITAILGSAQILGGEVESEQQEFIRFIEENAQRLLNTITSILDLAKVESGGQIQLEELDVARVARESMAPLEAAARKKGLSYTISSSGEALTAFAERGALERVLQNLIGNAVKFTEAGGVALRVSGADEHTLVEISDTGIGIEAQFLPTLFDAFTQESVGLHREFEGAGLGLALSKRLIEAMGGEIRVRSTKNEGSVFSVLLRRAVPSPGDGSGGQASSGDGLHPSGDGADTSAVRVEIGRR